MHLYIILIFCFIAHYLVDVREEHEFSLKLMILVTTRNITTNSASCSHFLFMIIASPCSYLLERKIPNLLDREYIIIV
jgi:hypothetical protein